MHGKTSVRRWRVLVMMLVAGGAGSASAVVRYVAPVGQSSPVAPYTATNTAANSIQVAVNAAFAGDEIVLMPGTYPLTQQVEIDRRANLVIRGQGGKDVTIIDAKGTDRAFYLFTSPTVELRGLTIRNGVAKKGVHEDVYGGGVYIFDGGRIVDCIIENSRANYGGGVRIRGSGVIESSEIRNNQAATSGGGVQIAYGGTVSDSSLYGNSATGSGGGIYNYQGGVITNSLVFGNSANFGGGIRLWRDAQASETPQAAACTVYSNTAVRTTWAGEGGGIQTVGGTVINSVVRDNTVDGNGGGVGIRGGQIIHSTIAHNRVLVTGVGGGIWTLGGTVQNSIVFYNEASSPMLADRNTDDTSVVYRYSLTSPSALGNNLSGLPQFVDPAARNYRLLGDSICIDAGLNGVTVDRDGSPRPTRGRWAGPGVLSAGQTTVDVGAYEYELRVATITGRITYTPQSRITPPQYTNAPLNIRVTSPGMDYTVTNLRSGPGTYTLTNLLPEVEWTIEAYLAVSSNRTSRQIGDPVGFYAGNPVTLVGGQANTNTDITLVDLDTDEDGLLDYDETFGTNMDPYGFIITDPLRADTDGDGFSDSAEMRVHGTNPTDRDSFPTTISGTISYSGTLQTNGLVRISVSSSGMTTRSSTISGLGDFSITNVPTQWDLTVTAYRDNTAAGIRVGTNNVFVGTDNVQDTWEPTGAYTNALTLTGAQTGINIVLGDPTNDSDRVGAVLSPDGLADYEEIFIHRTDHTKPDSDGDGMWDRWEVFFNLGLNLNPLSAADAGRDPDEDGLTNRQEYQNSVTLLALEGGAAVLAADPSAGLNPNNSDTDGDGMPDGWEWHFATVVIRLDPLSDDADVDLDSDGLTNLQEYRTSKNLLGLGFNPPAGLKPNVDDTDGDDMPDGWEVYFALDPLDGSDAGISWEEHKDIIALGANTQHTAVQDPDYDVLSNLTEYQFSVAQLGTAALTDNPAAGLNPKHEDTDGDGMGDGWEAQYPDKLDPLVDDAAADWDGDGLSNFDEYLNGTNPTNPDSDGDGATDGAEIIASTDPLDPLSYPVSISGTLSYAGAQTGLYHVVAHQVPTGSVYTTTITNAGLYVIGNAANANSYTVMAFLDVNGNATQDTWEARGTFSDTNGVPVVLMLTNHVTGADIVLEESDVDSDGDGLSDYDEISQHNTDPDDPDTDGDSMPDGWEVDNGLDPLDPDDWNLDPDVDGLRNADENFSGTDPNNPDTDGDGLTDGQEVLTYTTNPLEPDTDGDGLTDFAEIMTHLTNPLVADTDGDSFSDGFEVQVGTEPIDPLSFPATVSGTVAYVGAQTGMIHVAAVDADTNIFSVAIELPGAYSLTNLPTLRTYTISAFMDTNGDQLPDTWEAQDLYAGSPVTLTNDMAGVDMTLEHPATDTDGDGLSDYDEVIVHGTDPENPDSDSDGMPDGWEVQYGLDPLADDAGDDPDGDSLTNLQEFGIGTAPTNADTDNDAMPDGWESQYTPELDPVLDDATENPDSDGLANRDEYLNGTDPTNPDTDGDSFTDGEEVGIGSDPLDPNSYPFVISGTVYYGGTQTGTVWLVATAIDGVVSNALVMTGTSVVYSVSNLVTMTDYTISAYRDSTGDGIRDNWEATGSYAGNPILAPSNAISGVDIVMADPLTDSDSDGLTDYDEVYTHLTDPANPDSDSDGMPDGWEVTHALDPLAADSADDPDNDLLSNFAEYQANTDPNDSDTDNDGMPDGWEVQFVPDLDPLVDDAAGDPDLDGLTNIQEYGLNTNPTLADTDSDGMPDGWEALYVPDLNPLADDAGGDADGDLLTNIQEYQAGTNPSDPDTDIDGHEDGFEVEWKSDPLNVASFPVTMSGTLVNATSPMQTGTVYIVLNYESNANHFANFSIGDVTNITPPQFSVQYVPTLSNYWITAFMDLSGDGQQDAWEPYGAALNGTNSIAPTNDFTIDGLIPLADSSVDSDGDGLTNYEEVNLYGTDPFLVDTDSDGFSDYDEVMIYGTDPREGTGAASFPASISGSVSYAGTNTPSGPLFTVADDGTNVYSSSFADYATGPYSTATNLPTLTNYTLTAYIDSNTNGVLDLWEARGMAEATPFSPLMGNVTGADIVMADPTTDFDGDGLTDYDEHFVYLTDPTDPDTDGDGMPDGWEVHFGLDPLSGADGAVDTDLDGMTSLEEYQFSTNYFGTIDFGPADGLDPTNPDTDDDGLFDGAEVLGINPTDPLNADFDGDGMPDGWEVHFGLNPLVDDTADDPDGDGLTNLQEYEWSLARLGGGFDPADGLDPTIPDTDGDLLSDGDEVLVWGTDPLLTDSDNDGFSDHEEVNDIGSDPLNKFDPVVVNGYSEEDPAPGDPQNTDYDTEDGSLEFPHDSIQEGVDRAEDGFTVLVLDGYDGMLFRGVSVEGSYKGPGNYNINPLGKAITIRSRARGGLDGAPFTEIMTDVGNGFIVNSGEGRNTVIKGFTIRTRVADLGSAGVLVDGTSPTISDCRFYDCGEAGVLVRNGGRPLIIDSLLEENQGGIKIIESHPRIERSILRFNEDVYGGGIWITGSSSVTSQPEIVNCLIARNTANDSGGGIYAGAYTRTVIINTTIADNQATVRGGGIYNNGDTVFRNGILWGNIAPSEPSGFYLQRAFAETSYSCMQTPRPSSIGVFVADPRFAGPNNYALLSTSLCINAGVPYEDPLVPHNDILGLPRTGRFGGQNYGYDVGAYENQPVGALYVQSPGGTVGQVLDAGLPHTIRWTYDGTVGTNLVLEYTYQFLADPTLTWQPLAADVPLGTNNTGSYVWTVPVTNTTRVFVRVRDADDALINGVSPFPFGIANGIQIYAPTGAVAYYLGQTVDVAWAASSPAAGVTALLALTTNGLAGATLTTNVAHLAGGATNTFGWLFDSVDALTTNGRIRVSSGTMTNATDAFRILGLVVTIPGAGAEVQTGTTYNVRWTGLGAGPAVDIRYSDDGGGSFSTVSNGVANVNGTNVFAWTVPLVATSNAVLEIGSPMDTNIVGRTTFVVSDISGGSVNILGDGVPDAWKIAQGLDPENLDGWSGAGDDPDGDGASNWHEWLSGTDPLDGESVLGILSVAPPPASRAEPSPDSSGIVLRWRTVPGRWYVVETTEAPGGAWTNASGLLQATGNELDWTDPQPGARRFYRIGTLAE